MFSFLVRITLDFLQAIAPWIWRLIRMMFMLSITALTSIYMGVPQSVNRIADSWIEQATEAGIPLGYYSVFRTCVLVVAIITLILGWLVLASLTVFILRIMFFG